MKFFTSKTFLFKLFCFFLILVFTACQKESSSEKNEVETPIDKEEIEVESTATLYGIVTDDKNLPVKNVVVSDGFTTALTNEKGVYQMKRNVAAKYVFYSLPENYEIEVESKDVQMASFYKKITVGTFSKFRADFKLKTLASKQDNFYLIAVGDPQVTSTADLDRFKNEFVKDIKAFTKENAGSYLGLTLGDVVGDKPNLYPQIKNQIAGLGFPMYTTIGNHDKSSVNGALKDERVYSESFGPVDYSFNKGNVHFICLDNVKFSDNSNYTYYLSDAQINWVKEDLSYVPKEKMVIVYFHIPIRGGNMNNRAKLLELLKDYKEVHLMSGHTHYNQNYIYTSPTYIYEHIHGATCGAWWRSTVNVDGAPNGYGVYEVKGNTIANWFYKPINYDKNNQMRLHYGDASFGGTYGVYKYGYGNNVLLANIWNADKDWKVEVFEDDIKTGEMALAANKVDAWAVGYHAGVLGRTTSSYTANSPHTYTYTIKNTNAKLKVVATDRFGTKYTKSKITTDYIGIDKY